MDWQVVIKRQAGTLREIIARLRMMAMQAEGDYQSERGLIAVDLHLALLRILRPAESAVRRLIVIAESLLPAASVLHDHARPFAGNCSSGSHGKRLAFALFDPRKRFAPFDQPAIAGHSRAVPRIWVFGAVRQSLPISKIADQRDKAALIARIAAASRALDNLPREARRLRRHMRSRAEVANSARAVRPMRPGLPPGAVRRGRHPIHEIVTDCDVLARMACLHNGASTLGVTLES